MAKLSKEGYLKELLDIREKLDDFLTKINDGKRSYYKDISVKLRILYCTKSGTEPLLKTISELYDFDIYVAVIYSIQEKVDKGMIPPSIADSLVFEQINSVVTWFERGSELVPIFEAFERPEILLSGNKYSYKGIIEVVADKMGGAHIDPEVENKDLALHMDSLLIGGLPPAERALFDTARASIHLINLIEDFIENDNKSPFIKPRRKQNSAT